MKRFLVFIIGILCATTLSACSASDEIIDNVESTVVVGGEHTGEYITQTPAPEMTLEEPETPTIEELGQVIEAAGNFWEDWWNKHGVFSHTDGTSIFIPTGDYGMGLSYAPLLPASGFESLEDIRNYLLNYYTEALVDTEMVNILIEHDGRVYFNNARAGFPRFDWSTATHTLVEQDGSRAIVETSVLHGYFVLVPGSFVVLRFHLYDGRINYIEGGSIVLATLDFGEQESEPWNEFAVHFDNWMLFIAPAFDSLLASFSYIHEVDYTDIINARDGVEAEPWGDRIAIWASRPLFQLELLLIGHDMLGDDLIFIPISAHNMLNELQPGQVYVINNYVGLGTLPWSGITFLDGDGERHNLWMQHDNSDSPNIFFMRPFEDRTDELPDDWVAWWNE